MHRVIHVHGNGKKKTCPKSIVRAIDYVRSKYYIYVHTLCACELLLNVLAKVSTLRKQLPSIIVDTCLYHSYTMHEALTALHCCVQSRPPDKFLKLG